MAENQKREITKEELQNNLQAAINQLRVLDQRNKEMANENQIYKMTDFYQRAGWLWTILKEGESVKLPEEFINRKRDEFVEMFTLIMPEEGGTDLDVDKN